MANAPGSWLPNYPPASHAQGKRFNLGGVGPAVAGAMVVLVAEAARLHFNLSSISSTNRALLVVLAITAAIATQRSWRREGASRLVIVGLAVAALFLPITIAALASVLIAVRFATIKKWPTSDELAPMTARRSGPDPGNLLDHA